MNTSKEHFSPTNGEILPQNADNFAQNLDQSAQNLSGDLPNANLNAPNLPNANFHNPRAEFSANNAYENFSNPNNPRAFMNADENPRFMPYSPSQNPRANARELQERTGFFNQNGEHLGAKEAALMNGSVDFTHLKKADFAPNSSANLAFESANDVLTWRAPSANAGENLKPNRANNSRANEANSRANEAQNSANLGANSTTPHANLDTNSAHSGANLNKRGGTLAHENSTSPHANLDANGINSHANGIDPRTHNTNPHANSTNRIIGTNLHNINKTNSANCPRGKQRKPRNINLANTNSINRIKKSKANAK